MLSHVTNANMGHLRTSLSNSPRHPLRRYSPDYPRANCEADCITALISCLHQTFHPMFPSRAFYFEPCPFHFFFLIVHSPQPQSSDNRNNFHILISMAGRTRLHRGCISKCNIVRRCNQVSCSHAGHAPPTLHWRRPMQGLL